MTYFGFSFHSKNFILWSETDQFFKRYVVIKYKEELLEYHSFSLYFQSLTPTTGQIMKSRTLNHLMIITCAFFIALSASAAKQPPTGDNRFLIMKSFVTASAHPDSLTLICYAQISNSQLQFIKADSIYQSRYEWTIQIRDKEKHLSGSAIVPGSESTLLFPETTNPKIFQKQIFRFTLAEGTYQIYLELFDMETRKGITRDDKVTLKPFKDEPVGSTEILFFANSECGDPISENLFPRIPAYRAEEDSLLSSFFIIYTQNPDQPLRMIYDIVNDNGRTEFTDTLRLDHPRQIAHVVIPIPREISFGQYEFRMSAQAGTHQAAKSATFSILWASHSEYLPGLRQSIDVLAYAMDRDEYDRIRSLPKKEQMQALHEFWAQRDPNPATPENELEDEYYSRVLFANQHFSSSGRNMNGWETDRGRIYITYGPPSDIEHPQTTTLETSKYEIWYYRNIQKRFIFRDPMGTGDYQLFRQE